MLKGKLTTDEIKAHLTLEEIERIGQDREQMTYTTTQFIESLVEERIQKAALLAACRDIVKAFGNQGHTLVLEINGKHMNEIRSAIKQAGEA